MNKGLTLPQKKSQSNRHSWHGMAFIVEALVLMVFIVLSISVLIHLFGLSQNHSESADSLSSAVILASNEAERFSVDPSINTSKCYRLEGAKLVEIPDPTRNDYIVTRNVVAEQQSAGTLYRADISVLKNGEVVYEIQSARYISALRAVS